MYWAGLAMAHEPLVAIVFGGKYLEYSSALIIIAAVPVVTSAARIFVSALRAIGRPDAEFRATLASAAVSVTAGVALVVLFGLWGAAMGLVLTGVSQ
jgi:O-antigen/teichoic acid export membrane protein